MQIAKSIPELIHELIRSYEDALSAANSALVLIEDNPDLAFATKAIVAILERTIENFNYIYNWQNRVLDEDKLNAASWKFVDTYKEVTGEYIPPLLFNKIKDIQREVIKEYLKWKFN